MAIDTLIDGAHLTDIADSIRVLNGTSNTYYPSGMDDAIIAAIPRDEREGEMVHIDSAAAYPAESVVTTLEPVQDLHGYDRPWPAGGGKNLLPMTVDGLKAINTSGTWNGNIYNRNNIMFEVLTDNDGNVTGITVNASSPAAGTTIFRLCLTPIFTGNAVMSGCPSSGSTSTYVLQYSNYDDAVANDTGSGVNISQYDYTQYPDSACMIGIYVGYQPNNLVFKPMIRLASVTDPTFEPYSNECPIGGHTGVELTRTGKNLCDGKLELGDISSADGSNTPYNRNMVRTKNYIPVNLNETYTLSRDNSESYVNFRLYDKNKSYIGSGDSSQLILVSGSSKAKPMTNGISSCTFYFTDDVAYLRFQNNTDNTSIKFQLELGTTATAYEPYTPETNSITFPAQGKNLANFVNGKGISQAGYVEDYAQRIATVNPIKIEDGISYVYTCEAGRSAIIAVWNGNTLVRREAGIRTGSTINTSGGDRFYIATYSDEQTTVTVEAAQSMVRDSQTSASYEPYTNTVYGCTVDFVRGKLRVNRKFITLTNKNQLIRYTTSADYGSYAQVTIDGTELEDGVTNLSTANAISSMALGVSHDLRTQNPEINKCWTTSEGRVYIRAKQSTNITSVDDLFDYFNGATVCYELANPIEYDLTPEVITLLKGENNVWTDSGTTAVTYLVDVESYVAELRAAAGSQSVSAMMSTRSLPTFAPMAEEQTEDAEDVDEPVEDISDEIEELRAPMTEEEMR